MPKLKSHRLARKKIKVTGSGKFKRAQANTSHNTAKKPSKRMRKLRQRKVLDKVETAALRRLLPYGGL